MKIKEFVERYNNIATASLKEDFIRDTLNIKTYIPFIEKVTSAKNLVRITSLDGDNIKYNTPSRALLAWRAVLEMYTDLEVETEGFYEEYDLLKTSGILNKLKKMLPEDDVAEFYTIIDMTQEDFYRNHYEAHAFISSQVERFAGLLNVALKPAIEKLTESIQNLDESKIEKIGKSMDGVIRKFKK